MKWEQNRRESDQTLRPGGWWEINGALTDMLLKLKRAKFCFLRLRLPPGRQMLPETETSVRQFTLQDKKWGEKTHKQKPKDKIGFVRFLLAAFMDSPSSSSLWSKELYRVECGVVNFPCALLCWSGNQTIESYSGKKYKINQRSVQPVCRVVDERWETKGWGEAAVCRSTFLLKIKQTECEEEEEQSLIFITSPSTEPRWTDPTAPRWSASPGRRSPPACRPARWLKTQVKEKEAVTSC